MTHVSDGIVVESLDGGAAARTASSYLDWSSIFGGAALAAVVTAGLTAFGAALGLSAVSAEPSQSSGLWAISIATGIWTIWLTICANFAGGYLSGRMRRPAFDASQHEREVRDGSNGLVVWAIGALLMMMLIASGLAGAARTAASGATSLASGAGQVISETVNPLDRAADLVGRTSGQAQLSDADQAQIRRILTSSLSSGSLPEGDRNYLASQLSARAGLSEADARGQIDAAVNQLRQAQEQAKQAAERARRFSIVTAFLTAAALLLGGATAWFAAQMGGRHRDEELDWRAMFGGRA